MLAFTLVCLYSWLKFEKKNVRCKDFWKFVVLTEWWTDFADLTWSYSGHFLLRNQCIGVARGAFHFHLIVTTKWPCRCLIFMQSWYHDWLLSLSLKSSEPQERYYAMHLPYDPSIHVLYPGVMGFCSYPHNVPWGGTTSLYIYGNGIWVFIGEGKMHCQLQQDFLLVQVHVHLLGQKPMTLYIPCLMSVSMTASLFPPVNTLYSLYAKCRFHRSFALNYLSQCKDDLHVLWNKIMVSIISEHSGEWIFLGQPTLNQWLFVMHWCSFFWPLYYLYYTFCMNYVLWL